MEFKAAYPVHPTLKKHIKYYYFAKTEDRDHHSFYASFPNTTIPVNIHRNVHCTIDDNKISIASSSQPNYVTLANALRESPLQVEWKGPIDKITIAFDPVDINHFLHRDLNTVITGFTCPFRDWDGDAYTTCITQLFACDDTMEKVNILENFLVGIYQPFEKAEILRQATCLLSDVGQNISIPHIAARINTSERTLNRLFQNHMGISPVAYRKIARFRQSLENKVVGEKFKRLTDVGFESNYYDQSHFNKMYNALAGKSPKDLYKAVARLADDHLLFEFR